MTRRRRNRNGVLLGTICFVCLFINCISVSTGMNVDSKVGKNPATTKKKLEHESRENQHQVPITQGSSSVVRQKEIQGGESISKEGENVEENLNGSVVSIPTIIRFLFLSYYGSLGSLMPYLPVYFHSLGHGGLIIGALGAVKPLTTFLVAPIWGVISDRSTRDFGKFQILYLSFGISLVGQSLVVFRKDVAFLLVTIFITAVFNAPVKSLIDSIVLDHLENKADYGRMRLWGQVGFGLGSSGVGILLSQSQQVVDTLGEVEWSLLPRAIRPMATLLYKFWMSITGYRLLFLTHAALSIPTWMGIKALERLDRIQQQQRQLQQQLQAGKSMGNANLEKENQTNSSHSSGHISHGLALLLRNRDALLFFFLVLVVGISSGIIENFAYVRMREVGGTGKEMGLSRLVSSAAGAPMFWVAGPLTERLGADRVLVFSLLSYVVRFFIYALMRNPYHGLPAEALRGVTFAAFWSTGTIYAHKISPPGLSATMLMFLNAMYGGLGQSLGAIIGGRLQSKVGTVSTFIYSGCFDLVFVCFVALYLYGNQDTSSFRNPVPIGEDILGGDDDSEDGSDDTKT